MNFAPLNRRAFLGQTGLSLGSAALGNLIGNAGAATKQKQWQLV